MSEKRSTSVTRREFITYGAYALAASAVAGHSIPISFAADMPKPGSADWPRYGYDIRNTRFNAQEKTIAKSNAERLKLKWKFDIKEPIETTSTVIGDTLFFGAPGAYYALDSQTGQLKWKYDMPKGASGNVRRGLQYYKGRVYSGNQAGWVHCLDAASGKVVW